MLPDLGTCFEFRSPVVTSFVGTDPGTRRPIARSSFSRVGGQTGSTSLTFLMRSITTSRSTFSRVEKRGQARSRRGPRIRCPVSRETLRSRCTRLDSVRPTTSWWERVLVRVSCSRRSGVSSLRLQSRCSLIQCPGYGCRDGFSIGSCRCFRFVWLPSSDRQSAVPCSTE